MTQSYEKISERIWTLKIMAHAMKGIGPDSIQQYLTGKIEAYENCLRIVAELEKGASL